MNVMLLVNLFFILLNHPFALLTEGHEEHEEKHASGGLLPAFAGTSFKKLVNRIEIEREYVLTEGSAHKFFSQRH